MDEIIALDKELLLALNGSHSLFIDGLAQVLTKAATWIPLYAALIYLVIKNSENVRQIVTIIGCAVMCAVLAGTIDDTFVKPMVARFRPTFDTELGRKYGFRTDIIRGEDGSLALSLKADGKIHLCLSRKCRPITDNSLLKRQGSIIGAFKIRLAKLFKSFPQLFAKKDNYEDKDDNLIKQ